MDKKIVIFAISLFAIYLFFGRPETLSAREIDSQCDIVMFSTSSCHYCAKARALFDSMNVEWCEKDINKSANDAAVFNKIGGRGVPVTVIGESTIHGYNPDAFKHAIKNL